MLQPMLAKPRQACRRAVLRHVRTLSVRYQIVGFHTDISRAAITRDISSAGIGLLTKQPVRPGTCLRVHLNSADGKTGLSRAVVVRHFVFLGGQWLMGCSFSTELTREELDGLLLLDGTLPNR